MNCKNKSVDFSFIIPTYNRKDKLFNAIKSVIGQKSDNWELIVVDDGSTDGTKEAISSYHNINNFIYFFQNNQGVASARNKGVELSSGGYLIFLDSDDEFSPELIQTLEREEFAKFDFLCWQVFRKIDEKEFIWKPQKLEPMYKGITATFLAGSCCYKKEIFLTAGGFDPKLSFGENYELGLRISEIPNIRIKVIHTPLLKYYVETVTRTSNSVDNRLFSYIHQYKKHKEKYLRYPRANSKMSYLIGHVLEKSGKNLWAKKFYKNSLRRNPWNIKALIKSFFLKPH